jgi:thiol:disulfide interchange protein
MAEENKVNMTVFPFGDNISATETARARRAQLVIHAGRAGGLMQRCGIRAGALLWIGVLLVAAAACGGGDEEVTAPAVDVAVRSHAEVEVRWESEWAAAFDRARSENKPVLVTFSAEWCVWCKHLETVTFADAKVATLLAGRVVPLNIDIDAAAPDLLRERRIEAPPTIVLIDIEGRELGRIPGYMPPTGFLKTVEGFLGSVQG